MRPDQISHFADSFFSQAAEETKSDRPTVPIAPTTSHELAGVPAPKESHKIERLRLEIQELRAMIAFLLNDPYVSVHDLATLKNLVYSIPPKTAE